MSTSPSDAARRWAAFLQQIEDRHAAVCREARDTSRQAFEACGHDFVPISHAWLAVNDRLKELERRIIDTWNAQVSDVFEREGVDAETQRRERRKGEDLAFALENRREETEMRTFADASRGLYARAVATQAEHRCTHCGGTLDVPVTYLAVNLTCPHCRSVGTFEPGAIARTAIASGAHAMAREVAFPEWLAMREAERAIRDVRSPTPLAHLKAYEAAQVAYWFKYLGARAPFEPALHDLAYEVRSRMQFWWTSMESEEEWRRAGSPRLAV